MIRSARGLGRSLELSADLCVVGTGAGGAMVARQAARAGLRVIALESGPHLQPKDFDQREDDMIPRLFQNAGARSTDDGAITILQGRGVGGSTVHNTNLCKRAPAQILDGWKLDGYSARALAPHYEVVERDLNVQPIDESRINRNNQLLRHGVEKLGWRGAVLSHNRQGCIGSGFCELGCSFDAKQNALKVLIPEAIAAGATVLANCRAERILIDRGRAVGIEASRQNGASGTVVVRAPVCLAASAIDSALLALRSGVPNPSGALGQFLRLHPGAAVAGLFDEPVEGWLGIPQSYECTEKLGLEEAAKDRTWITTVFAHPAGMASQLPGFGAAHMQTMRLYPRLGVLVAMLHDQSAGSVSDRSGRMRIRYELEPSDRAALLSGIAACAEILFAAGARKVFVPFAQPLTLESVKEIARITDHGYRPLDPLLTSVHPMGTMSLGRVTDESGRVRGLDGLWVADGSLFPTSIGGPPQLSIFAFAHKIAGDLVATLGH